MTRKWVALVLLMLVCYRTALTPISEVWDGAHSYVALIRTLLGGLSLPSGLTPLHTYTREEAEREGEVDILTLSFLYRSYPYVRQTLDGVVGLLQDEGERSENLIDIASSVWGWVRHDEDPNLHHDSFKQMVQDALGSGGYGHLVRWLWAIGCSVKVTKKMVDNAKTYEQFKVSYLNPFFKVLMGELPSFLKHICFKYLHRTIDLPVGEDDFPGLVEKICVLIYYDGYQDMHHHAPTWMVERGVYSLTVVENVVKKTECIEKALCLFKAARKWLSHYKVKMMLVIARITRFVKKSHPLRRIHIAFREVAFQVKGDLCCRYYYCNVTAIIESM